MSRISTTRATTSKLRRLLSYFRRVLPVDIGALAQLDWPTLIWGGGSTRG
jgi:hypothetical protein